MFLLEGFGMSREEELGSSVRVCFDELLGEIEELRESLSDLEDRVERLEGSDDFVSSEIRSFRLDGGGVRSGSD